MSNKGNGNGRTKKKTSVNQRRSLENLQMWKPGQSGNPKGRPAKARCIPDILEKIGQEKSGRKKLDPTNIEAVMREVFKLAKEGKAWAVQFIADRLEGRPAQTVDIKSSGGLTVAALVAMDPEDWRRELEYIDTVEEIGSTNNRALPESPE